MITLDKKYQTKSPVRDVEIVSISNGAAFGFIKNLLAKRPHIWYEETGLSWLDERDYDLIEVEPIIEVISEVTTSGDAYLQKPPFQDLAGKVKFSFQNGKLINVEIVE